MEKKNKKKNKKNNFSLLKIFKLFNPTEEKSERKGKKRLSQFSFKNLPQEMYIEIFKFLNVKELLTEICLTNKAFNNIVNKALTNPSTGGNFTKKTSYNNKNTKIFKKYKNIRFTIGFITENLGEINTKYLPKSFSLKINADYSLKGHSLDYLDIQLLLSNLTLKDYSHLSFRMKKPTIKKPTSNYQEFLKIQQVKTIPYYVNLAISNNGEIEELDLKYNALEYAKFNKIKYRQDSKIKKIEMQSNTEPTDLKDTINNIILKNPNLENLTIQGMFDKKEFKKEKIQKRREKLNKNNNISM